MPCIQPPCSNFLLLPSVGLGHVFIFSCFSLSSFLLAILAWTRHWFLDTNPASESIKDSGCRREGVGSRAPLQTLGSCITITHRECGLCVQALQPSTTQSQLRHPPPLAPPLARQWVHPCRQQQPLHLAKQPLPHQLQPQWVPPQPQQEPQRGPSPSSRCRFLPQWVPPLPLALQLQQPLRAHWALPSPACQWVPPLPPWPQL